MPHEITPAAAAAVTPLTVPLDALHRELGARMVPFAGYTMPVQYAAGVLAEHLHARAQAVLFDVSHMGQASLHGPGFGQHSAALALEALVPGDIAGLAPMRQRYTLLTNAAGGILDDLMVANLGGGRLFLVANASRKDADFAHIAARLPPGVTLERHDDRALLALQGPAAATVLGRLAPETMALDFLQLAQTSLGGIAALVSRSGYTGEDGYEISLAAQDARALAELLLRQPEILPAGLGARDSLRLEAGLCLYGSDIDELTSPVAAGLAWSIGKRRRQDWGFPGAASVRAELEQGAAQRRVGIRPDGRAPARAGTAILAEDGSAAGSITSGGFSPSLNAPIAMGYVRRDLAGLGTALRLVVRGHELPARVVPLPFVPHRYVRTSFTPVQ